MGKAKRPGRERAFSPVHPDAAAIDIGARMHMAAVGPGCDAEPVASDHPSQGRRMKSAHQKRQHVLVIPGGLLATSVHADPGVRSRSKRYPSQ
jgi:hypothetical protein